MKTWRMAVGTNHRFSGPCLAISMISVASVISVVDRWGSSGPFEEDTTMTLQPLSNMIVETKAMALPQPRGGAISIRPAVLSDLPFIDELQRKHSKAVGWFPKQQLETNIAKGQVLIAEQIHHGDHGDHGEGQNGMEAAASPSNTPSVPSVSSVVNTPVGYVISTDRYFKRDDCGIIYQLNVVPGRQRGLIGASLIRAVFARAAYGCKLFCCWCAQDLEANYFWESIGFVPLAFRTGSRKAKGRAKGSANGSEASGASGANGAGSGSGGSGGARIHIFWQRRIREGDVETPYWFPAETTGGAVRENRLVLPIPPGTHWSDAKPAVLPGMEALGNHALPSAPEVHSQGADATIAQAVSGSAEGQKKKNKRVVPPGAPVRPAHVPPGGLWFAPPPPPPPAKLTAEEKKAAAKAARAEARAQAKANGKTRNDPKLVAAARELRDRYIEQINEGRLLPPNANGKYEVSRQLEAAPSAMKVAPVAPIACGRYDASRQLEAAPSTLQQTPLLNAA